MDNSTFENIDGLFSKLNDNSINMFSFSDHNRFDSDLYIKSIDYLNSDSCKKKFPNILSILSSVEFDVELENGMDKCHIIAVFNTKNNDNLKKIQNLLENDEHSKKINEVYSKYQFEKLIRDIELDVILIASQRKSINNVKKTGNSFSDSTNDVEKLIKIEYISAFEIQKPGIQGMILNSLKEFPNNLSFVSGSDCHQWDSYPKHNSNEKQDKNFYFEIKSQPTFVGLMLALTSPHSRFNRIKDVNYEYFNNISINNKNIPLSSGINVIIGENGSGKSTFLEGIYVGKGGKAASNHHKRLLENNKFSIEPELKKVASCIVRQSEIIENEHKGFAFGDKNNYFDDVNNDDFENRIKKYSEELLNTINLNIEHQESKDKLKKLDFLIEIENEQNTTHYFQFTDNDNLNIGDNKYTNNLSNLNKILTGIRDELNQDIYDINDKKTIREAFSILNNVRNSVINKYLDRKHKTQVKNIIWNANNKYEKQISTKTSDNEKRIRSYIDRKTDFKNKIINAVTISAKPKNKLSQFPNNFNGKSNKESRGYSFQQICEYAVNENVENIYFSDIFNKEWQNLDTLLSISTSDELVKSISGISGVTINSNILSTTIKTKFDENISKFLAKMEKTKFHIKKGSSENKIGNTPGEQAIVYYDFISRGGDDFNILMIDQPEDNISNKKIVDELIGTFINLRDKKQLIIVTHNPLLVVNLDVDNVIYLNRENDNISIESGCLEHKWECDGKINSIINLISNTMDGGREAIERRFKIYGNKEN